MKDLLIIIIVYVLCMPITLYTVSHTSFARKNVTYADVILLSALSPIFVLPFMGLYIYDKLPTDCILNCD